ncbi:MAG: hypothetical protein CHACPFDD_02772 [Phycisphaerae bacterium]|nr:hypothetical protein [Phycisphaerae bacterium]
MSLKAFHVIFLTVATLFCFGFGAWGVAFHASAGGTPVLLVALVSLLAGVALPIYGVWFLRKLKHVSYL